MSNKSAIIITGILLVTGLLGELLYSFGIYQFTSVTQVLIGLARICGILLIFRQGTLTKERLLFPLLLIAVVIAIIGALFKITHAPKADLILSIGLYCTPIIYTIHFLRKANKNRFDILKLLWVTAYCIASLFLFRHMPYGHELKVAEGLLFLLLFLDFTLTFYRRSLQTT